MIDNKIFKECEKVFFNCLIIDNLITLDNVHDWVYSQYGKDDEIDLYFDQMIGAISLKEVSQILFQGQIMDSDCVLKYQLSKLAYKYRHIGRNDLYKVTSNILYGSDIRNIFSDNEINYLYLVDDEYIEDAESIEFLEETLKKYSNIFSTNLSHYTF